MKLLSSVVALTLVFCIPAAAASITQQSVELEQAVKLMEAAKTSFKNDDYKEAITLTKRALEIRERLLPADSHFIDDSLSYLGQLHFLNQQYGDARKTLQRLLVRREQKVGTEHESLTLILDMLAAANFRQHDFDNAEGLSLRSLKIKERRFGPESSDVAGNQYLLGEMYRAGRKFKEALNSYTQVLVVMGKLKQTKGELFEQASTGYQCVAYQSREMAHLDVLKALLESITPSESAEKSFAEILNGKALSLPAPAYPQEAKQRQLQGSVAIKVLIDEEGKVINAVDMCQGQPYLSQASLESAFRARFTATKVNGVPVRVSGVIVYNFYRR